MRGCHCGFRLNFDSHQHDRLVAELVSVFLNVSFNMFESPQWRDLVVSYHRSTDAARQRGLPMTFRKIREASLSKMCSEAIESNTHNLYVSERSIHCYTIVCDG